jgi:hypothetical protein
MKQFEYKVINWSETTDCHANSGVDINDLGEDGWELVTILHFSSSPPKLYFKREIEDEEDEDEE